MTGRGDARKASSHKVKKIMHEHKQRGGTAPSSVIKGTLTMKPLAAFLLLSLFLMVFTPRPVSATFSGTLTLNDGKLSARISAIPLDQVLEEFSRVSGVPVRWLNGTVSTETVSVEFTNLAVSDGLRHILDKKQFILFYSSTTPEARLTQLWITAKGDGQALVVIPSVQQPEPSSSTEYDDPEEDDKLATLPPEQLTQVALQDEEPEVREKAVGYLEAYARKDRRAWEALTRLAQHATDVEVQEFAAEALQQLE